MFESFKKNTIENPEVENSAESMIKKVQKLIEVQFRNVEITGENNLKEISPDDKVIFAITHISDSDVPIAISVLGRYFLDIVVADSSTHRSILENPMAFLGTKIAGERFFASVSHTKKDGKERGSFDPADFLPMTEILEGGGKIIIAAYYKPDIGPHLPDKGGYGAVYLSELTGATIIPVAIDIKTNVADMKSFSSIISRPDVVVNIGKPILYVGDYKNDEEGGIKNLSHLIDKRKNNEAFTENERTEFSTSLGKLREKSSGVMQELATLLPEDKRGIWNKID